MFIYFTNELFKKIISEIQATYNIKKLIHKLNLIITSDETEYLWTKGILRFWNVDLKSLNQDLDCEKDYKDINSLSELKLFYLKK